MRYVLYTLVVVFVVLVVGLVSMYSDIPRYEKYWNKRASEPVADDALVYVALGDSTAQAIGAAKPANGYVGRIAKALHEKHRKPVHVINLSVSGAKVKDALGQQLPAMELLVPDVVTIEIGANDMKSYVEADFRRDMDALMTGLPKHTVISDIPYFGGGRRRNLEPRVIAANKIIRELADRHQLRLAPLFETTKTRDSWRVYAMDYFHPSDQGYENWFAAFWQILQK